LQQKDYSKARELLEDVLKDPLISNIQVDNIGSDQHLLQLRSFLIHFIVLMVKLCLVAV